MIDVVTITKPELRRLPLAPDGRRGDLPKVSFSGYVWLSADARANIERTAASLAERLGPTTIHRDGNVLGGGWAAGPAARHRSGSTADRDPTT